MLTYADVCEGGAGAAACNYQLSFWGRAGKSKTTRERVHDPAAAYEVLTYAGVCWRMLTYADVS